MPNDEKFYGVPPAFSIDLGEITQTDEEESKTKVSDSVTTGAKDTVTSTIADKEEEEEESNYSSPQAENTAIADDSDNPDDDDEDEDLYSGFSESAKIAIAEIKTGTFDIDEKLIPKDLNLETLHRLYQKSNELKVQEEIERVSAAAGEAEKYVKFLLEGGDPAVLKQAMEFKEILDLDPEEEEDQKLIIGEELSRKGLPEDEIQDLVTSILDKGKGKQRATAALAAFRKAEDDMLTYYKEEQEQIRQEQKRAYNEYVTSIQEIVDRGQVAGVKLSKKDQKEVLDALFTPTEIVDIVGNDGKPRKTKVTKIQALQNELNGNKEKIVAFALWLLKDSNFSFAKEQGKEEEVESLADVLRSKRSSGMTKREGKLDNLVDALTIRRGR